TQANAPAFLALTIQALIKLNCFASYLLRQPLKTEECAVSLFNLISIFPVYCRQATAVFRLYC
ncbi:hypothetical protein, partial [Caballeronia mineralivorans]|uniref:hypothetical protein n=1 Tax=Caballeronia mineralivorans TaxID=2010198 RepID=UPI0023F57279